MFWQGTHLQTVHRRRRTGHESSPVGSRMDALYSDVVDSFLARVEPTDSRTVFAGGEERTTEAIISTSTPIEPSDLLFLPGQNPHDASVGRTPLRVQQSMRLRGGGVLYQVTV